MTLTNLLQDRNRKCSHCRCVDSHRLLRLSVLLTVHLGLEKDLGMEGIDLNIALTIFYVFVSHDFSTLLQPLTISGFEVHVRRHSFKLDAQAIRLCLAGLHSRGFWSHLSLLHLFEISTGLNRDTSLPRPGGRRYTGQLTRWELLRCFG